MRMAKQQKYGNCILEILKTEQLITDSLLLNNLKNEIVKQFWMQLVEQGMSRLMINFENTYIRKLKFISKNVSSNSFLFFRVDSIMLLEEGFTVTSVDASDKMLKQAHKTRWNRRKEEKFDEWGIF